MNGEIPHDLCVPKLTLRLVLHRPEPGLSQWLARVGAEVLDGQDGKAYFRLQMLAPHLSLDELESLTRHASVPKLCGDVASVEAVSKGRSLVDVRPDLAVEWHPTKNGSLTPSDVGAWSGRKVYWKCSAWA